MTRFPTSAHLVSWAGLAPVARQSGPRSRKPGKGQGDSYLRGYCTQAATGAATTDTFLGERLRRLSRRLGGSRARCAVGRSILVIIWHLLADPEARYTEARLRLARSQDQHRPQDPQPPEPAPRPPPRQRRHHHPRRLKPNPADQARYPECAGPINHARIWWGILTVSVRRSPRDGGDRSGRLS